MKYLNTYETMKKETPKIGDYVIVHTLKNYIGKIVDIIKNDLEIDNYIIEYDKTIELETSYIFLDIDSINLLLRYYGLSEIKSSEDKLVKLFNLIDIEYFSSNINDIKSIILSDKYNI